MVSDESKAPEREDKTVSIRFEVRGGFRPLTSYPLAPNEGVSIRFEVRGGFRLTDYCQGRGAQVGFNPL